MPPKTFAHGPEAEVPFALTDDGLKSAFGDYKISSVNLPRHKYGFLAGRTVPHELVFQQLVAA